MPVYQLNNINTYQQFKDFSYFYSWSNGVVQQAHTV
jgi:hypothetical protein